MMITRSEDLALPGLDTLTGLLGSLGLGLRDDIDDYEGVEERSDDALFGPGEHTGLAGTADHLGNALKQIGEGLGDLL
ncbi:hypothetical protein GALMADRAFT_1192320 [Galerina marginata CBS 339.88]|uniref:Uncharacterized protein n=1 Tax=Galerina marginata (strain CBS 339.88) TaxID=685588 RepID=A0A067TN15_GALM3|nr:hypothetical protein GALMADRAFT_1192320 [Galerina marginata CBS 339.88]